MIELGLQRISRLLSLGTRPLPWKAIHIAGTNGKGSVAAYVAALLHQSGFRVGRFTSPHFIDRWDCITLNQKTVSENVFRKAEESVKSRNAAEGVNATEFEVLTATAFELFGAQDMEVAVIECGLGGRGDATNVLRPQDVLVSVITKVGLDHTEFLGDTIEAITGEKAGIVKKRVPVVVDPSNVGSVKDVVKAAIANLNGAERLFVEPQHTAVDLLGDAALVSLAEHQRQNLVTAFTAFETALQQLLRFKGSSLSALAAEVARARESLPSVIEQATASMPGRLQWLKLPESVSISQVPGCRTSPVLLDGAHNPQAAEALSAYVDTHLRKNGQQVVWLLGIKRDKDVESLLQILLREEEHVVVTSFGAVDGMPWVKSWDPEELASKVERVTRCQPKIASSMDDAIRQAANVAGNGPLVIAGSLYLVSDVLRWLRSLRPC